MGHFLDAGEHFGQAAAMLLYGKTQMVEHEELFFDFDNHWQELLDQIDHEKEATRLAAGETEAAFADAVAGMTNDAAQCSGGESGEDDTPRFKKVALTEEEKADLQKRQRDLRKANKKAVKQENKAK